MNDVSAAATLSTILQSATPLASVLVTGLIAWISTRHGTSIKRADFLKENHELLTQRLSNLIGFAYKLNIAQTELSSCEKKKSRQGIDKWKVESELLLNEIVPLVHEIRMRISRFKGIDDFHIKSSALINCDFESLHDEGKSFQRVCLDIAAESWKEIELILGKVKS